MSSIYSQDQRCNHTINSVPKPPLINDSTRSRETQLETELDLSLSTRQEPKELRRTTAYTPYPYQKQMIGGAYRAIGAGIRRILLIAIMGSGKTVIASWIMRDAASRGKRVVFLVSLNVLIDQTLETLQSLGVEATALQGDRPFDGSAPVIVASLQTVRSRLRRGQSIEDLLGDVDLFFGDEAHLISFDKTYIAIEEQYLRSGAVFIGMTATPWRLSKKEWLGQRFDHVVKGPQPPEIIRMGKALPCRSFTLKGALNLDELHTRAGEYIDSEIASQAMEDEALNHVVEQWFKVAFGRPSLMIGATVAQAMATCDRFNSRGVRAEIIVGSTKLDERRAIFTRVEAGETQIICSVGCLTAGFNLPCISCIIYVRATKSKALFHQTAGRGARTYPGKTDYLLLDFGKNLKAHGNPMGLQDYDISEPKPRKTQEPMTKTCPECSAEINVFAQICPECGNEFSDGSEKPDEELELKDLSESFSTADREKVAALRRWRKAAWKDGRSPDEAINRFVDVYGYAPPNDWMQHACLTRRYSQRSKLLFIQYVDGFCNASSRWADQWTQHHLRLEFGRDSDVYDLRQWWNVLGIPPNSTWDDVKGAYCRISADYHPDTCGDDAAHRMDWLNLALSDARADLLTSENGEVAI